MLFKPLALATVAASLVLVPIAPDHEEKTFHALPVAEPGAPMAHAIPETSFDQRILVPCEECKGPDAQLGLDFRVEDETRLLLNGFELYPNPDPWGGDLEAAVMHGDEKSKTAKLGYHLVLYPRRNARVDDMEFVEAHLKIMAVGGRFVGGIPTVKVKLVKAADGSMAMTSVDFARRGGPHCSTVLCRAKQLADKLWAQAHRIKGCGGKAAQRPGSEAAETDRPETGYWPAAGEPDRAPRQDWRHLVRGIVGHIMMPIVMGVMAGVAVAFVALCIQALARRLVRLARGERDGDGGEPGKVSPTEAVSVEEKAHLMG